MAGWIKTLWTDSIVYGIGYAATRLLQIIILPIIAHALSLPEFGYYSNYVIFYNLIGGLLILGLDSAVTRFFYDSEDKHYHQQIFSSAFWFIAGLGTITAVALYSVRGNVLHMLDIPLEYGDAVYYVIASIPVIAVNGFLLSWFKWKKQKINFLINSGGTVLLLLLPLVLVAEINFHYLFAVLFWSQCAVAIVSTVLAMGYLRPFISVAMMGSLLRYGFPWMLVFLFGASRSYLDRVFLTRYLDDDTYGLYNFSVRISTLISLVITAFDMSFGPLAFSIWNKDGAKNFFARLQSVYVFVISAIACGITIVAPFVIKILGGLKYEGAEKVVPILLFAAIPLSLINFSNLGTSYAKKSFLSTLSLFIGFAAVLLFNVVLTRQFLQYGATTASLIGHLLIIITGYILSARYYRIPFSFAKDGIIFVLFFLLSLCSANFSFTVHEGTGILIELLVWFVIVFIIALKIFPRILKEPYLL